MARTPRAPRATRTDTEIPTGPVDQNQINAAILQQLQALGGAVAGIQRHLDVTDLTRESDPTNVNRRQASRAGRTREATSRKSTERIPPHMGLVSMTYVDPSTIPAESRYFWMRESTLGQPDEANVTKMMMAGWKPVPATRHPELIPPRLPGREDEMTQIIRRGGLILMEKPEAMVQEAERYLRELNLRTVRNIQVTQGGEGLNEDDRVKVFENEGSFSHAARQVEFQE